MLNQLKQSLKNEEQVLLNIYCPLHHVNSCCTRREKLIGFWKLDRENHMITCSATAGEFLFLNLLPLLLEAVRPLLSTITLSDPYLHESNKVEW